MGKRTLLEDDAPVKRTPGASVVLSVASTGLYANERARVMKQAGWRGSRMTLVRGFVPPCREELELFVKDDAEQGRARFFATLYAAIKHRAGISSIADAETWFEQNTLDKVDGAEYNFMTQAPGDVVLRMDAVAGGKPSDATVITEDALASLVGAEMTPMDALRCFLPASEHSDGTHRHRLIFILAYWVLVTPESLDDQPIGASVYQVSHTDVSHTQVCKLSADERITLIPVVQDDARVYLQLLNPPGVPLYRKTRTAALALFARRFPDAYDISSMYDMLCKRKLPVLKSLVQKIIRARPASVRFSDSMEAPADQVLTVAVLAALTLSSFNPHGGGVETGLLAMLKRVGVIIPVEDAWHNKRTVDLLWATCMALAASRDAEWVPPVAVIEHLIELACAALHSTTVVAWKIDKAHSAPLTTRDTDIDGVGAVVHTSFLLEHFLGGMSGDMAMMRAAAHNFALKTRDELGAATWTMPAYHCIDQHCATGIAYLFAPQSAAGALIRNCKDASRPMSDLFTALFTRLTGLNPRRQTVNWHDAAPLLEEFRAAQRDYWQRLTTPTGDPVAKYGEEQWDVTLPYSWLAYAVGTRFIKHNNTNWQWNLNPDALDDIHVAPVAEKSKLSLEQPSETKSHQEVVDEQKRDVVRERARFLLSQGITVDKRAFGTELRVRLHSDNSTYHVDGRPWEEFRCQTRSVPTGDWSGDSWCMDRNYAGKVAAALSGVELPAQRLAISLLRSFSTNIEFPRPDRGGGAGRQGDALPSAVQWGACLVWSALSRMTSLVVQQDPVNPACFSTPSHLLPLRHLIATALEQRSAASVLMPGKSELETGEALMTALGDEFAAKMGGKQLRLHQRHVLTRLMERVVGKARLRSHFVWLDVGAGKTAVSLLFYLFLRRLRAQDDFVCLFVTSPEAFETVQGDAAKLSIPSRCINKPKDVEAACTMKHGVIFARHDTIKKQEQLAALLPLMGRALFVLDEAHLAMGKSTLRTDGMQFLARVACDSLLMTATPLRNTREATVLQEWMQMAVSFPCTESTSAFNVALSSMLHHPLYDRVATQETLVPCGDDTPAVKAHIPRRMGGTSDAHQFSQQMGRQAYAAACEAVDAHMVTLVRQQLQQDASCNVWLVCEDAAHVAKMKAALLSGGVVSAEQVWSWASGVSVRSMNAATGLPYRVGIVPMRVSTGYSATHFNVRVRGVYPSNEANRAQIDGRIARYGQPVQPVRLYTVHAGITTLMLNMHINAANFTHMIQLLNE